MPISPDGTAYDRTGPRDAPSVVLIHGLGLNREVWQWMLPALSDTYDVVTYDLYGHGQSAAPPKTPSLALLSTQLDGLMETLGVSSATIIGFSLGGMICRRFAQDYPQKTQALVILNSPHRRTPEAQTAILARVDQARDNGPQATVEHALQRWFTDGFRAANPNMMQRVRNWVLANDPAIYPTIYRVLAEGIDEITDPAIQLSLPVFVITADEDYGNGPEMTKAIAANIDGSEALILPGLRHMALAEDPDAVNHPIRAFLDSLSTNTNP
ncbi:alpha/beta fold hydrolase [Roseovarius sp. EL26]|uniref:alpha/beta fold hydrolase n=1 Tax=Roseovarius sp. EL26 TaxID=2126672 RepID=UPI000EA3A94A|nr:alpha/beta hydrolase [Roseovarius sp. EL26]